MTQPTTANQPLITIVIPVYNREAVLMRTLRSIQAQTLRPLRVILVDNSSRDGSMALMQQWQQSAANQGLDIDILTESRRGAPAARNAGLAAVQSPWVMFFDSDDEMAPHHCARFAHAIQANPQADIVGAPVTQCLLSGRSKTGLFTTSNIEINHLLHSVLATQRYAVSTSLIKRVGGWDNRAWAWNDYELGVRLLLQKPMVIKVADSPAVTVHSQVESITGTGFSHSPAKWENTLDICQTSIQASGRDDLLRWIDVRRAILAARYRREGARSDSRRLLRKTLSGTHHPLRMRLLYAQHRICGFGTSALAKLLLGAWRRQRSRG